MLHHVSNLIWFLRTNNGGRSNDFQSARPKCSYHNYWYSKIWTLQWSSMSSLTVIIIFNGLTVNAQTTILRTKKQFGAKQWGTLQWPSMSSYSMLSYKFSVQINVDVTMVFNKLMWNALIIIQGANNCRRCIIFNEVIITIICTHIWNVLIIFNELTLNAHMAHIDVSMIYNELHQ